MSSERRYDTTFTADGRADEVELTWGAALAVLVLAGMAGAGLGCVAWAISRRARRS